MKLEEIVSTYVNAAIVNGDENSSTQAANKAHDRLLDVYIELRKLPDRGKEVLSALINHENLSVKTWAATHLLPIDEKNAVQVLEEASREPGLGAITAKIVLQEWKNKGSYIDSSGACK